MQKTAPGGCQKAKRQNHNRKWRRTWRKRGSERKKST